MLSVGDLTCSWSERRQGREQWEPDWHWSRRQRRRHTRVCGNAKAPAAGLGPSGTTAPGNQANSTGWWFRSWGSWDAWHGSSNRSSGTTGGSPAAGSWFAEGLSWSAWAADGVVGACVDLLGRALFGARCMTVQTWCVRVVWFSTLKLFFGVLHLVLFPVPPPS